MLPESCQIKKSTIRFESRLFNINYFNNSFSYRRVVFAAADDVPDGFTRSPGAEKRASFSFFATKHSSSFEKYSFIFIFCSAKDFTGPSIRRFFFLSFVPSPFFHLVYAPFSVHNRRRARCTREATHDYAAVSLRVVVLNDKYPGK